MGVAHKTALGIALIALGSAATALAGGISDGVVKIGVLTDMSGQFSHESGEGAVTAVKMAVEDFGGTVLGKPIEVVSADHQNKPEIASAIACKWYDVEKVDMIANLINSSVALGVSQIAKDKERIAIINGSGSSRLTNDACTPNSVHYAYDTYSLARGTAGSRHVRRREGLGRASAGFDALSSGRPRSVFVSAQGAVVPGQGRGAGRVRHGVRQCGQIRA
jgi:branched-chain amino acid transport system substrate-binding protein